jgi:hypothetical protein
VNTPIEQYVREMAADLQGITRELTALRAAQVARAEAHIKEQIAAVDLQEKRDIAALKGSKAERTAAEGPIRQRAQTQRYAIKREAWAALARDEDDARHRNADFQRVLTSWILFPRYEPTTDAAVYINQLEQATAALRILGHRYGWANLAPVIPPMTTLLGTMTAHNAVLLGPIPEALRQNQTVQRAKDAAMAAVEQFDAALPFFKRQGLKVVKGFIQDLIDEKSGYLEALRNTLPDEPRWGALRNALWNPDDVNRMDTRQEATRPTSLVGMLRAWYAPVLEGRPSRDFSVYLAQRLRHFFDLMETAGRGELGQHQRFAGLQTGMRVFNQPVAKLADHAGAIQFFFVDAKIEPLAALAGQLAELRAKPAAAATRS